MSALEYQICHIKYHVCSLTFSNSSWHLRHNVEEQERKPVVKSRCAGNQDRTVDMANHILGYSRKLTEGSSRLESGIGSRAFGRLTLR